MAAWLAAGATFAAHPLQTEDTATQGAGNIEIENGLARSSAGSERTSLAQVQVSYGLLPTLDLLVQPSWLQNRAEGGDRLRGWGDTNLDFKWRFYGDAPFSLALRAGLAVASGRQELGLRHGTASPHTLLVATWDGAPYTAHANLGCLRLPAAPGQRRDIGHASTALMWAQSESLTLSAEAVVDSNPAAGRSSWPGTVLVGAIYTLQPGLDLDLGRQASVRAQPSSRGWLIGLTYRFAP